MQGKGIPAQRITNGEAVREKTVAESGKRTGAKREKGL